MNWKADMSWMQKLHETYEQCAGAPQFVDAEPPLLPICHTSHTAHIEFAIDGQGNFLRAVVLSKVKTVLPATEKSMTGRTSGVAPYPLSEKIHYCAADYPKYGGKKKSYFAAYADLLASWCRSSFAHLKAKAVYAYICKGTVVTDLVRE